MNTLNAVRTTLLSITKKPDHTQNEPLAIMRQGVEEERGYGSTGGVRGRRGKGTAGAEGRRRIKEYRYCTEHCLLLIARMNSARLGDRLDEFPRFR